MGKGWARGLNTGDYSAGEGVTIHRGWATLYVQYAIHGILHYFWIFSRQVSLSPCLKGVHVGMKVEVVNCSLDVVDDTDVAFWVATVIEIKHYRVQLRYEGYESNPAGDFWFDLRSKNIHPVGWCAKRNKLLIPPPGTV